MHRREVLQWIGGAVGVSALAGVSPERLLAVGRTLHDRVSARTALQQALAALNEHQAHTVATIAEHIIPETDTPGARAARVEAFIDLLLAEWFDDDERVEFLRGLANVDTRSLNLFGTVFVRATEPEQVALLRGLDAELTALREAGAEPEDHFFHRMKWLTLYGYYTSEIGQTQELGAAIIPGRYDACGPVRRDTAGSW
jgi:hypothetical protein